MMMVATIAVSSTSSSLNQPLGSKMWPLSMSIIQVCYWYRTTSIHHNTLDRVVTPDISWLLRKMKVHHHAHNSLTMVPVMSQMNPVHKLPLQLFKIHFKIIHLAMSSKWFPSPYVISIQGFNLAVHIIKNYLQSLTPPLRTFWTTFASSKIMNP